MTCTCNSISGTCSSQLEDSVFCSDEEGALYLQTLTLYAHDLAQDVLVMPKRIQYSRMKEEELYPQLINLASKKQSEIKELIHQVIADVTDQIIQEICQTNFKGVMELDSSMQVSDTKSAKKYVHQIQEVVFRELSKQISDQLVSSVNLLRESVMETLQRCLEKLEERVSGEGVSVCHCVCVCVCVLYVIPVHCTCTCMCVRFACLYMYVQCIQCTCKLILSLSLSLSHSLSLSLLSLSFSLSLSLSFSLSLPLPSLHPQISLM